MITAIKYYIIITMIPIQFSGVIIMSSLQKQGVSPLQHLLDKQNRERKKLKIYQDCFFFQTEELWHINSLLKWLKLWKTRKNEPLSPEGDLTNMPNVVIFYKPTH